MCVRHFNIAGVAWSNLKPSININRRIAILNDSLSIDVVNVGAGIHIAVVQLKGKRGGGRGVRRCGHGVLCSGAQPLGWQAQAAACDGRGVAQRA